MNSASKEIIFFVNGRKVVSRNVDPEVTLLYYLRNILQLTGTKQGCNEGGCGACTVMMSRFDHRTHSITHFAVVACLVPLCSVDGMAVTTVEGIGSTKTRLHPVQERLAKVHGSQCGFCSPGMVMSMYALLRNNPTPSEGDINRTLQGNLCRCTGYRPIKDGFKTFTKEFCCGGRGAACCMQKGTDQQATHGGQEPLSKIFDTRNLLPLDPTQDPIFPPELMLPQAAQPRSLYIQGERVTWIRPSTLDELIQLKTKYPKAKLVIGNTRIGLDTIFLRQTYPVCISVTHIPELNDIQETISGITVRSSVSIATMANVLEEASKRLAEYKTRTFIALLDMFSRFGSQQIRNVAGIGGSIITASPTSDLNPILMAAGCTVNVLSTEGKRRELHMDNNFFLGKGRVALEPNELLLSVSIPFTRENEFICAFKQSRRREMDSAIVNACMRVRLDTSDGCRVKECCLGYGGMAATTLHAQKSSHGLVGRLWDESVMEFALPLLEQDLPLSDDAPGGQVSYRRSLAAGFFFKFYIDVTDKLRKYSECPSLEIPETHRSAPAFVHKHTSKAVQTFQDVPVDQGTEDAVGRSVPHLAAYEHATGEAVYLDDIPHYKGELYLSVVLSERAHAQIMSIDTSEALQMPGVHAFISTDDVPGSNEWGVFTHDELVFYSKEVTAKGQVIGAIVADSQPQAKRAAQAVRIEYKDLPAILTIEEAVEANSFFLPHLTVQNGDLETGFGSSDHVIEGEMSTGAQDHFYLETNVTIAVPGEHGEMELFSSTQDTTNMQSTVASILGVPRNRIVARVKRLGGGFGGKQIRCIILASAVAVAAKRMGRPVRCVLDRDEDMRMTGMRHPFKAKYKVGFTQDGQIQALDTTFYSNAGYSLDQSVLIMQQAFYYITNAYRIPNVHAVGYACKTNLPSNTAYRGYGIPQAALFAESWVNDTAQKCGISQRQVREINFLRKDDLTLYNQPLTTNHNLQRVWDELHDMCSYEKRKAQVDGFNRDNRWKKRGMSVVPTMFGMPFDGIFLNQAGALVHVYTDGSVLLTHGGIEMGQGLHTKMVQIAARVLDIPVSGIYFSETSTNTVPNTIVTAASCTADLNGMAVKNACEKIVQRIAPFKKEKPNGTWQDWVQTAYFNRVSLSATGFYKWPGLDYNPDTRTGTFMAYFTYGAACSEVEIDCLTGDHQVLRTDILMDVGNSLNPAIDIGQIEGGFVQGQGYYTLEDVRFSSDGALLTAGPGSYKIPGLSDTPAEFNVHLLKDAPHGKAIYSSKGVGEPSLMLASSVFFAIKNAITSARHDSGVDGSFQFDSPATCERIRMACVDNFTKRAGN